MSLSPCVVLFLALFNVPTTVVAATEDSAKVKPVPWKLHLQSRFSLVDGKPLALWGGGVGYVWGPKEREITVGYQWLGARGTRQLAAIGRTAARRNGEDSYYRSSAGFASVGYWHIVYNSRRWKFGFPLELGVGRAEARRYSLLDAPLGGPGPAATIVPLQAGSYAEWKATRWVGIGLQVGYRRNLAPFAPVDNLNGPYGRFRVLVYAETYRDWYRFIFRGRRLPSPFFSKNPPR